MPRSIRGMGGGIGWLGRKHGLACDSLIAVTLVTADGRVVRASSTEHPDLFWAVRGAGANFGVVTSFEFGLHPVGPALWGGEASIPATAMSTLYVCWSTWRSRCLTRPG